MPDPALLPTLILCDKVIIEQGTQRQTLIGIINDISVDEFPNGYGPVALYVRATGFTPQSVVRITFQHSGSSELLFDGKSEILGVQSFDESTLNFEMSVSLPGLPLPEDGLYNLSFFVDEKLLSTLQIPVRLTEARK